MRFALPNAVLVVLLLAVASAQQTGTVTPITPAISGPLTGVEGPIISESYILMPGDQVMVTISGGPAYSYSAWVTYEGKVFVEIPAELGKNEAPQVVDAVRISGLNLKDAQDSLTRVFSRYFRSPVVKLTLMHMRSGVVFVTGEVQWPGAVYASPVDRVSQVIAKAGGLTPLGSKTRIQVIRENRVHAIVDIARFENNGDISANPFVESGDRIYVPPAAGMVTVKGAVFGRGDYRLRTSALTTEKERVSEGMYELIEGERVLDMIKKAGGITPWADLKAAYILRTNNSGDRGNKLSIDLSRILFHDDTTGNILLENNDVIVVPPVNTLVYVEGEVTNPGSFLYTPNLRVDDYIGMAGGPTNAGHTKQTVITRGGTKLKGLKNPTVEPGDIIYVPRVTFKWWQDYLQIFSSVGMPVAIALLSLWATSR